MKVFRVLYLLLVIIVVNGAPTFPRTTHDDAPPRKEDQPAGKRSYREINISRTRSNNVIDSTLLQDETIPPEEGRGGKRSNKHVDISQDRQKKNLPPPGLQSETLSLLVSGTGKRFDQYVHTSYARGVNSIAPPSDYNERV